MMAESFEIVEDMAAGASFSDAVSSKPNPRLILLVSGTFNPPHVGHIEMGHHAARALLMAGKRVSKIIYCPVHDNYVVNKIVSSSPLTASKSDTKTKTKSTKTTSVMFSTMADRLRLFRSLLDRHKDAVLESKGVVRSVVDYEHQRPELLQTSSYWFKKQQLTGDHHAPSTFTFGAGGYLKTVSTARLVKSFSEEYSKEGFRVAVVLGADNVAYMPNWEGVRGLFSCADLVIVGRKLQQVNFQADPSDLLSNFATADVQYILPHTYRNQTLFGDKMGRSSMIGIGGSSVYLVPPLPNGNEGKSSTLVRTFVSQFCEQMRHFGYEEGDIIQILQSKGNWKLRVRDAFRRNKQHWVQVVEDAALPELLARVGDGSDEVDALGPYSEAEELVGSTVLRCMFAVLCGVGVGVSLTYRFMSKL